FITFRLQFRHTQANQGSGDTTQGSAGCRTAQCRQDWTCRHEGAETWNRQGADSHQPSQTATENTAHACASAGTFRHFSMLLVSEVLAAGLIWKQCRHIVS